MSLVPLKTNVNATQSLYAAAGSGGGGGGPVPPNLALSSLVVTGQGSVSTLVSNFGLMSTIFTGGIAGTNNNTTITNMSSITSGTVNCSTVYAQGIAVEDSASIPLLTTSTLTVNQTVGAPGVYQGGIEMPVFSGAINAYNSLPNANTIGIKNQANWDANANSTLKCVNIVTQGDFGGPLGLYDELSDLAVGRLLVGGSGNGVGLDPQVSGPKPFITAVNTDWTTSPPSAIPYPGPPALQTSPIFTDWSQVSSLYGPLDNTLLIQNTNSTINVNPPPAIRLEGQVTVLSGGNPVLMSTTIDLAGGEEGTDLVLATSPANVGGGSIITNSDQVLLFATDNGGKCGVAQIYEGFTQIWNNSGVSMGIDQTGTLELQISSIGQVQIYNNLTVSSINGFKPAYTTGVEPDVFTLFKTLFEANPSLSTIPF